MKQDQNEEVSKEFVPFDIEYQILAYLQSNNNCMRMKFSMSILLSRFLNAHFLVM